MRVWRAMGVLGVTAGLLLSGLPGTASAAAQLPAISRLYAEPDHPAPAVPGELGASVVNIDWPSKTGLSAAQQQAELIVARRRGPPAPQRRHPAGPPDRGRLLAVQGRALVAVPDRHAGRRPRLRPAGLRRHRGAQAQPRAACLVQPVPALDGHGHQRPDPDPPGAAAPGLGRHVRRQALLQPRHPGGPQAGRGRDHGRGLDYDIDGVHFDDYFYPYPVAGQVFDDAATYAQYGAGFPTLADWRRNNIDLLIHELSTGSRRSSRGSSSASRRSRSGGTRRPTPRAPTPPRAYRRTTTWPPTPASGSVRSGSTTSSRRSTGPVGSRRPTTTRSSRGGPTRSAVRTSTSTSARRRTRSVRRRSRRTGRIRRS